MLWRLCPRPQGPHTIGKLQRTQFFMCAISLGGGSLVSLSMDRVSNQKNCTCPQICVHPQLFSEQIRINVTTTNPQQPQQHLSNHWPHHHTRLYSLVQLIVSPHCSIYHYGHQECFNDPTFHHRSYTCWCRAYVPTFGRDEKHISLSPCWLQQLNIHLQRILHPRCSIVS